MKTLIELYKSVLSSVGMVADNQGFISTILPGGDTPKPFSVESKRLVLPTDEQLKQTDWSNRIGFHPLSQNLSGGESRVMEKFRDRMNSYADFMLGMLLVDIAQLGVKKEMHKDLTPDQAAYLGPFSDADEKFVRLLTDLVSTKRVTKKNFEFIRFSVIKGRSWQNQKRSRVAVIHFPLYEALPKENKTHTILNHKLRIADVKMLRQMYEFLFPNIREQGYYEVGSDSKIAPSLESLMAAYSMFTKVQNHAVQILEPVINTSTALMIVDDWRDDMAQVEKYLPEIRKIPFLEGNAPSERITQTSAPQRISETPEKVVRAVTAENTAPVIPATVKIGTTHPAQEAQQVQANQSTPRFKLGMKSPTVENSNEHQITDAVANQVSGLSYQRPSVAPMAPTPPVGTIFQQQQQAQPQQQFQQPQPMQNVLPQQTQLQAMKIPETARYINNQLYIPLETDGVAAPPPGALMVEGKIYVPMATVTAGVQPVGFQQQNRFGAPAMQQQITDPSQIPGLSAAEIQFYRSNPVMFQNFLQQMNINAANQAANVAVQRQQAVPRYIQQALQQAQQQQMQPFGGQGFFRR